MNKVEKQIKENLKKIKNNKLRKDIKQQARTYSQQARRNLKNLSSSSVQTLTKVAYMTDKYNTSVRQNLGKG